MGLMRSQQWPEEIKYTRACEGTLTWALFRTSHCSTQPHRCWLGLPVPWGPVPLLCLHYHVGCGPHIWISNSKLTHTHKAKIGVKNYYKFSASGLSNLLSPKPNTLTSLNALPALILLIKFLATYSCPCWKPFKNVWFSSLSNPTFN